MKEFSTAAKKATEDEEDGDVTVFKVDDDEVKAYEPSAGQLAMLYSALSDHALENQQVSGLIDFFLGLLDEDSRRLLGHRLIDREDPFELDQVTDILMWLVEEWSGRPIKRPSASSRSRRTTGKRSTVAALNGGSTPSDSPSTVSST